MRSALILMTMMGLGCTTENLYSQSPGDSAADTALENQTDGVSGNNFDDGGGTDPEDVGEQSEYGELPDVGVQPTSDADANANPDPPDGLSTPDRGVPVDASAPDAGLIVDEEWPITISPLMACQTNEECLDEYGDAYHCVDGVGQCGMCERDEDCTGVQDEGRPTAFCRQNRCVQCGSHSDCTREQPYCEDGLCGRCGLARGEPGTRRWDPAGADEFCMAQYYPISPGCWDDGCGNCGEAEGQGICEEGMVCVPTTKVCTPGNCILSRDCGEYERCQRNWCEPIPD